MTRLPRVGTATVVIIDSGIVAGILVDTDRAVEKEMTNTTKRKIEILLTIAVATSAARAAEMILTDLYGKRYNGNTNSCRHSRHSQQQWQPCH